MRVAAEADRLRREGVRVLDFAAGEPDFHTPEHIVDAARRALDEHFTKYTPTVGIPELRQAIADSYKDLYGVSYSAAEVITTAGGKQALYNAAMALFGPGDEVITHAPGWPTITEQIKLAEAEPVIVRSHEEDGFALHADAFIAAITPRTRGIVINSPTNPTGALMSERAMRAIADAAADRGLWVMLDLCYERLIYGDVPHNLPKILVDRMRDRAVLCGSMSKAYAMTGWRCGWAMAPVEVIKACNAIQSNSTSNVNSITQKAAVAALRGPQDCLREMRDEYLSRRDKLISWLTADPRLRVQTPAGTFFLFVDVSDVLSPGGVRTSAEFAQRLLDETRVVLVPGEAFDAPGFVRISYAAAIDQLQEASERLLAFVRKHAEAAA